MKQVSILFLEVTPLSLFSQCVYVKNFWLNVKASLEWETVYQKKHEEALETKQCCNRCSFEL